MTHAGIDLLERRVVRLLKWLEKSRTELLDMGHGRDEGAEWCRDEAERIQEHMKTVRDLYDASKRAKGT